MSRVPAVLRNLRGLLLALACLLPFAAPAADPVWTPVFSNLALDGYDPVAYFTDSKPVKGSKQFSWEWQGAEWRFATAEHLAQFKAEPARWAPQYGGYCAYGVTRDYLVSVDPEAWAIVDGKLYLNYSKDVQKQWDADRAGFIRTADAKFPALLAK